MTTPMPELPRYKIGYRSDEWGMNSSLGLIPDSSGTVVRYADAIAAIEAATPQCKRQPLTDDEIKAACAASDEFWATSKLYFIAIARSIEEAHGIADTPKCKS